MSQPARKYTSLGYGYILFVSLLGVSAWAPPALADTANKSDASALYYQAIRAEVPSNADIGSKVARLAADPAWKLAKSDQNITIYLKPNAHSDAQEFLGKVEMNACQDDAKTLLTDATRTQEWLFNTLDSTLIHKTADGTQTIHSKTSVPWPLKNRDTVLEMRTHSFNHRDIVTLQAKPEALPREADFVRTPLMYGFWNMEPVNNGERIAVTYHMMLDPGGQVPLWVANLFVVDAPFETLKALRSILETHRRSKVVCS